MANSFFEFKQFTVWHDKCAMKVGTDGVLLGAWTNIDNARQILDVGTGTGLVALMLAQRSSADITAVEIDTDAFHQAQENIRQSPWNDRILVVHSDFRQFASETGTKYDVIVSNPPYFTGSLKSPDDARTVARHNDGLTFYELFSNVSLLLAKMGEFILIFPYTDAGQVINIAGSCGLFPIRRLNIVTSPGKMPKRAIISFGFREQEVVVEELLIEHSRHCYSDEYIRLTKDFYLSM